MGQHLPATPLLQLHLWSMLSDHMPLSLIDLIPSITIPVAQSSVPWWNGPSLTSSTFSLSQQAAPMQTLIHRLRSALQEIDIHPRNSSVPKGKEHENFTQTFHSVNARPSSAGAITMGSIKNWTSMPKTECTDCWWYLLTLVALDDR